MRVLLMSMPDTTPHIAKREWEAPSLGIASIAGNLDRRHEVWLADGEQGRFKRQMLQWARLNDFFGDMVIDESFFDMNADGPVGIGDEEANLHFGAIPRADRAPEDAPATLSGATASG